MSSANGLHGRRGVDGGVARGPRARGNGTINGDVNSGNTGGNTRGNTRPCCCNIRSAARLVVLLVGVLLGALPARAGEPGAYAHAFVAADGTPLPLAPYAGRPILVVNTGIYCDTPGQHDALQALWERYRERGLVVLAVPSDDFRAPDAGAGKTFCAMNLGLDYPMTTKVHVAGPEAHAFYRWAAAAVHEDYTKILVGPDGAVAQVFPAAVEPLDSALLQAIEGELAPDL